MPIDKETFNIAKDPSDLLIEFLEAHYESAYNVEEILEFVPRLQEIGVQKSKIEDTLISNWRVDSTIINGVIYYSAKYQEEI